MAVTACSQREAHGHLPVRALEMNGKGGTEAELGRRGGGEPKICSEERRFGKIERITYHQKGFFYVGRNGLVHWAQKRVEKEGPEPGSKRKRLRADFMCPKAQLSGGETSPAAKRAASVVLDFRKFGRLFG